MTDTNQLPEPDHELAELAAMRKAKKITDYKEFIAYYGKQAAYWEQRLKELDMTDTNQLPPSEREAFEAFAQNCPMGKYSIARRGDGYDSSHTQLMWDAWQARAQVPGEPVAWCIEAQVDGEWFVQYPITFTKQGAELDASLYTPETVLRIRPLAFGDTTPQPAQATQATPSIPSDGPSTYAQRFTAAVAVICGVTPPVALVCDWINKEERHDDLQQWVGSYAPGWVQNIAVLDAAHQMADQPTEGGNHEPAQQPATPASVQADSSEHLRVIASLGDALRRLSFAAQTTGGTAGPDAELQSAIGQAEQALSLGGIWQAMSATGEPVYQIRKAFTQDAEWAWRDATEELFHMHPKEHRRILYIHPAPSVPADAVRNAKRYEWLRKADRWPCVFPDYFDPEPLAGSDLDAAIDAAMLAAKDSK